MQTPDRATAQAFENALMASRGQTVHTAGTLSTDRWNGQERVQFRLMDMAVRAAVAR